MFGLEQIKKQEEVSLPELTDVLTIHKELVCCD